MTENKTITLAEFVERAEHGEEIVQELTSGESMSVRVFTPSREDIISIHRMFNRMADIFTKMDSGEDIPEEDSAIGYEFGFNLLRVCVRDGDGGEIPDRAFVDLYRSLPRQSKLMVRCQELCEINAAVQIPPLNRTGIIDAMKEAVEANLTKAKESGKRKRNPKKG